MKVFFLFTLTCILLCSLSLISVMLYFLYKHLKLRQHKIIVFLIVISMFMLGVGLVFILWVYVPELWGLISMFYFS